MHQDSAGGCLDRPNEVHRVYAVVDDQSNASIISTELADRLNAEGPASKYHLSTCGGTKVVKYGQRVTGVVIRSIHGKTSVLPPLVEYDGIPQDMKEILTPEIAWEHRHLGSIAEEIPPFHEEAKIHLLVGGDTPELLKVGAFKNSTKGAPWAQKLALEWTISGQTCLHLKDRPIHVQTKRTCVVTDYSRTWMYILVPIWFVTVCDCLLRLVAIIYRMAELQSYLQNI